MVVQIDASFFQKKFSAKKSVWIAWGFFLGILSIWNYFGSSVSSDGLRIWTALGIDTGQNAQLTEDQKVRALHFEVAHHQGSSGPRGFV